VIVVDSNVIAYCWIRSARTELAQRVRLRDPAWHVPILWRSELRSVLAGYLRKGTLAADTAATVMSTIEAQLQGREHLVSSSHVLALAATTRLSAYDCEFVALAQALAVPLVTEDAAILEAFPETALGMEAYLEAYGGSTPTAHQAMARYGGRHARARRSGAR
jgi:predicted nucleic acid-binding protein